MSFLITLVLAYLPNPNLSPEELRREVAAELGVNISGDVNQQEFTRLIHERLIQINRANKSVVLIIDEAQALPNESIEGLETVYQPGDRIP